MSQSKSIKWDYDEDNLLIELVKSKRDLYDLSSPRYNDNVAKRRHWEDIAHHLCKDGSKCKDRWESLRSQYRKHVNKAKYWNGQAATISTKWKYEDQMAFLHTIKKERSRTSTVTGEPYKSEDENAHEERKYSLSIQDSRNDEGEPQANELPPVKQVRPKRRKGLEESSNSATSTLIKYLLSKKKEEPTPDTVDVFFSLMAATVKKFSPSDQHFIKTKVFSLVSEIEGKYIEYQSSHGYMAFSQGICPPSAMASPSQHSDISTGSDSQPLQEAPHQDTTDVPTLHPTVSYPLEPQQSH